MGKDHTQVLIFSIIHKNSETSLVLSAHQTVRDLKREIYRHIQILPADQIIESWRHTPMNDTAILETCCDISDINYLIVHRSSELARESGTAMSNEDVTMSTDTDNNNVKLGDLETNSMISFVEYFSKYYDNKNLLFHLCRIKDAVEQACLTPLESRKILLLYFHNSKDQFCETFCRNLEKDEVQALLNSKFFILGWDVENETYQNALKEAFNKCCDLSNLDSVMTYSCMRGKVTDSDFFSTLKQSEEFLVSENGIENDLGNISTRESDMGSENYQQLMFDLLGDRDYDSFDYNEHDRLKEKIGFALFGPPQKEKGYEKKQQEKIEHLYNVIVTSNKFCKWKDRVIVSFVYACIEPLPEEKLKRSKKYPDYNPKTDLTPFPIFILRKCKNSENPCRIFIDHTGRVYQSWLQYIQRNKLDACQMILPKNGRYQPDSHGKVMLEKHLSPACGIDSKILLGLDIGSTTAGLMSGGVFITAAAIPAITVAPALLIVAGVTGAGVGLYSIGRSAYALYDRSRHQESMSFADSEARGAYLNIVAGSLGFVGAGANVAVAQLATRGFQIGQGATAAVNVIGFANIGASGIGIANSSYDVLNRWLRENENPSFLTMVQLSSSILFFGHAVYSFKLASTIVQEAQTSTLTEYQDSLRSNRHRKTFNKMLKATISQNDGNVNKGQAEVISTLRNIQNKDEVFAALTRSNKDMNKYGLKFVADKGEVKLNGLYTINFDQFGQMDKVERISFLSQIQSVGSVEPTGNQISSMTVRLKNLLPGKISLSELSTLSWNLAKIFGNASDSIKEKMINAVAMLIKWLTGGGTSYMKVLDTVFPNHEKYFRLFNMLFGYFQRLVDTFEKGYQIWKATQDEEYKDPRYITLSLEYSKRAIQIFNYISEAYFIGTDLTDYGQKKLLNYFYTWLAKQVVDSEELAKRREQRSAHSGGTSAPSVDCSQCGGVYYNLPKK